MNQELRQAAVQAREAQRIVNSLKVDAENDSIVSIKWGRKQLEHASQTLLDADTALRAAIDALSTVVAEQAPAGFVLVPREPTLAMLSASACVGHDDTPTGGGGHSFRMNCAKKEWAAMLDAAPALSALSAVLEAPTEEARSGSGVPARPTLPGELRAAAQAVVDRWETPLWKDAPATGTFIYRLRDALAADPPVPDVAAMVNRFLGWKLPKTFGPDCYISFDRTRADYERIGFWPVGTNLFTADEAKAMFLHALAASPLPQEGRWMPIETMPQDGSEVLTSDGRYFEVLNKPPGCDLGVWAQIWPGTNVWSGTAVTHTDPTHWMPLPAAPGTQGEQKP